MWRRWTVTQLVNTTAKVQWVESRGKYPGTQSTDVTIETPRNQWFRYVGGVGVLVKTWLLEFYFLVTDTRVWRYCQTMANREKKPIETNGEAYVSRFAVDLEHTIVNIITANAVAIVDVNRYYCDRMADTHRRKGRHFARRDLATGRRRSCWRQRRMRRPAGRTRWISTRPFCQTYDEDANKYGGVVVRLVCGQTRTQ